MKTLNELGKLFFDMLEMNTDSSLQEAESDKLCFRKSFEKFLESGRKEDAFVVYFCFSEIFKLFGKGYDNTKKLLETLSDHEYHSGELLAKHRDHYSHSVYVFALGLAIYASDGAFRRAFLDFYSLEDNGKSAFCFLRLWGMVALFHDVGYPFQLAHEQIKTYSQDLWGENDPTRPYVSFGNLNKFLALSKKAQNSLQNGLHTDTKIRTINELLAYGLHLRDNYDIDLVKKKLFDRIVKAPEFMDHGYFSAVILARQLFAYSDFKFDLPCLDVFTAILLHNSFNKYDAPDKHPIAITEHPLAYLLILCDELQSWDRLAYGKISKQDPIAWDMALDIGNNTIVAKYFFDSCIITDANNEKRLNKSFEKIQSGKFTAFVKDEEEAERSNKGVYIVSSLHLQAIAEEMKKEKRTNLYASDDSFINLCDFAKAIHAGYSDHCKNLTADGISEDFANLPLEFKVSNIEQAKSYAYKLELINCFYSSKDLDYPVIEDFKTADYGDIGSDNFDFLCREEHLRWVREKINLGWRFGEKGKDYLTTEERNRKKLHQCLVPFELLREEDKTKDEIMIQNIIPFLKKFGNNIRVYNYRMGRKPDLVIAGTGHRFIADNVDKLKEQIKKILSNYEKTYRVIVRTGFAYGADQIIAECANELGLTTKAALPLEYDDFIRYVRQDAESNNIAYTDEDEMRLRLLLAQTAVCRTISDPVYKFAAMSKNLVDKCDKLIALWDGEPTPLWDENHTPINQGGTYHCIQMAKDRGLKEGIDIHYVRCHRK